MLKNKLRLHYSHLRDLLTKEEQKEASIALANRSLSLPIWDKNYFHLFLSIHEKSEVDTSFLLSILQGRDKEVIIPKMLPDHQLEHYLLTDNTPLRANTFGIPEPLSGITVEPKRIEVVFLPLLVFDRKGYRVGYGGGYYDRFLAQCPESTVKVGLSFFDPVEAISDLNEYDVAMDFALTPKSSYEF
jgi:5-formyltetrahydrofolate cyclo-ligase